MQQPPPSQPQNQQQLHSHQPLHLNNNTQQHQHLSYQQQQSSTSSYLDSLSDSPSLSFLNPIHSNGNGGGEPFNPNSILRDQSKSFSLGPEESSQYRSNAFNNAPTRPRGATNGVLSFDDLHSPFANHDIYSSQQQPPQNHGMLDGGDKGVFGNVMRNNSIIGNGGPYGTGSTLPESQQVAVNKG